MIGSFITRALVLAVGYAYPAYECFKTVERNKPNIDQLRFWCQYWILVAGLTVCERIGDTFVGWIPLYGEAKVAFFLYLWLPKTKGTTYVYDSFFRPYVVKHEAEIDRNLSELKVRAADMALLYWQKASSNAETMVLDILKYIASQSYPTWPAQPDHQQGNKVQKPSTPLNKNAAATPQAEDVQPISPTSSSSSTEGNPEDAAESADGTTMEDSSQEAKSPTAMEKQKTSESDYVVVQNKTSKYSGDNKQLSKNDSGNNRSARPSLLQLISEELDGRVTRAIRSRRTRASESK